MKLWKFLLCVSILDIVWFPSVSSVDEYADEIIMEEDMDEITNIMFAYRTYITPVLERHDLTFEDIPHRLNFIIAKYWMIVSDSKKALDTLQELYKDHEILINNNQLENELFEELVEKFTESINTEDSNMIDIVLSQIPLLQKINVGRLTLVRRKDAIKLLLFQEVYTDITETLRLEFSKFYENNELSNGNEDDEEEVDATTALLDLIKSNGRIELVQRLLLNCEEFLDQFISPVQRASVDGSLLNYLDDLHDYSVENVNILRNFLQSPTYTTKTDDWIESTVDILRKMFSIIPLKEILSFFDALALNVYDRRCLMILIHALNIGDFIDDAYEIPFTNASDLIYTVMNVLRNVSTLGYKILLDTVAAEDIEVSKKNFLENLEDLTKPYHQYSNDLSDKMKAVISRVFDRFNSLKDEATLEAQKETLEQTLLRVRNYMEKLRDSIRILSPDNDESSEIRLESMLQTFVNKYGPYILELQTKLLRVFNDQLKQSERGTTDGITVSPDELTNQLDKLEIICRRIRLRRKNISHHFRAKLLKVTEMIDVLANVANVANE